MFWKHAETPKSLYPFRQRQVPVKLWLHGKTSEKRLHVFFTKMAWSSHYRTALCIQFFIQNTMQQ
eukprot:133976-Karenia_brevis.AAC.1